MATDEERPQQDGGERKSAARPGGHPGVDRGAPAGTEALGQGMVDDRPARSQVVDVTLGIGVPLLDSKRAPVA
ncbi:hypothetical protein ACFVKB_41520 [Rhodococcus sp. NPDC127530]|uniref:hypothetical protein n=1 Tax=unclassified Rhodococcus (in: high G+C Gram-positive bacteria) TaxID=192944 RepID=UPI00363AE89E